MQNDKLVDRFGRKVDSFRASITSRCNFSCIFCHHEGLTAIPRDELLSPDDYGFLSLVAKKFGIVNYKLTGGEPLVRKDAHEIVRALNENGLHVTMSTNGYFLKEKSKDLSEAGLERANVSLHSLNLGTFSYLTGTNGKYLEKVIEGINEALSYGIDIKLNFILMNSNKNELKSIVDFASSKGVNLNLIELIPLGTPKNVYEREHFQVKSGFEYLEKVSVKKYIREFQNRPVYVLPNGVEVTVIIGYGNPYLCSKCSRLRLTPEGRIKTCIFVEDKYVDILKEIKNRDEDGVAEGLRKAVLLREPYFKFGGEKNVHQNG
ncbi:GTP 3',8-cyclase MoaA [Fervidicoccus fontis]|uniref:GTP 3',8-cyclase MoaA n=1 Tax=Fervidicoccus fontis TaxID=683846 RepID=UPI000AE275C3|nr:GTP 3',8-cyclase MoaA [Fervidicoccus fontis]